MLAIFFVSSLSNPGIGGDTPDYVLHGLEYFLLALLLIRLLLAKQLRQKNRGTFTDWRHACLFGLLIAIAFGVSDEIHQYFVPGRHCSFHDVISDTIGALLAYSGALLGYHFPGIKLQKSISE